MITKIYDSYIEFLNRENKDENGVSKEFTQLNPDFEKQNETNERCWNCSRCSDCSRCSGCSGCSRCSGCSGCSDCSDCSRCSDCSGCSGCSGCYGCYGCSGCSRCSDCSGCYGCSDCSDCSRCSRCSDCSGCSGCSGCYGCSGCSRCSDCSGCYGCSDLEEASPVKNEEAGFKVPIIENIHQKILEAVKREGAFEMGSWHQNEVINEEGAHCGTTHCRGAWAVALAGKEGRDLERKTTTIFAAMQIYHASSPNIPVNPPRFFETNTIAMRDIERCAEEEAKMNTL